MDNESFKIFTDVFNNVCFPIACCIALFYLHFKQVANLTKAINENTKVLNELKTIIELKK